MSDLPGPVAASSAAVRDRTPPNDRKIPSTDKDKSLLASDSTTSTTNVETRSMSTEPAWRRLSPTAKYNYNWANAELHAAIREDHSWLNPDPVKAEQWKKKLLANDTPTRSLAMYKKWRHWQETGALTRPRSGRMRGRGVINYQALEIEIRRARYSLRSGEK